jgi:hypothetical protein
VSGNPRGTTTEITEYREALRLTKQEFLDKFSQMMKLNRDQIKQIMADPNSPMEDVGIATAISAWACKGDSRYLDFYFMHFFGVPKATELRIPAVDSAGKLDSNDKPAIVISFDPSLENV